ncbi:MAG: glycosyltransferase family 2 protein [Pseudomonadota bacterium]|nr:glycosyltransferase family 2 protein [Pseudomonadota bacterium]
MRIAAVIVTHAGGRLLAECIASLAAQTRPPDEVLVVVSRDDVLPVEGAPALQLRANVGYARAANAGIAATSGEPLLLNDDTRLDPGCLAALAAAFEGPSEGASVGASARAGPRGAGVYQPRIVLADGSGRLDNLGHGLFPDGAVWARGRNGPLDALADRSSGGPGGFSGAAVLFARATWDALGGFDARFGSFGEDVDLSLRLLRRGIAITPVPDAVVHHHLGATWGRASAEKLHAIERNRVRAAVRSLPLTALLSMPAWTAGRYALYAALAARGRGPGDGVGSEARRAAIAGLAAGVRDAPTWWQARREDRRSWTRGEFATWRALWAGRARWEDVGR